MASESEPPFEYIVGWSDSLDLYNTFAELSS